MHTHTRGGGRMTGSRRERERREEDRDRETDTKLRRVFFQNIIYRVLVRNFILYLIP